MKANLPQAEPKMLARWEKEDLYGQIRKSRAGTPHLRAARRPALRQRPHPSRHRVQQDHQRLHREVEDHGRFRLALRPRLGLPWAARSNSRSIRNSAAKKAQMSAARRSARACRKYAQKFVDVQREDFKRLGVFGRWDDPYLTMSAEYQAVIAGAFVDFLDKGYVYKGLKPVNWCIHDRTALAEAEVEYENHSSPSIWVRFALTSDPAAIDPALAGKKVYGLIWTTTPWTIPANMAIAFHPKFEYAAVGGGRRGLHRRGRSARAYRSEMRLGDPRRPRALSGDAARRRGFPPSVPRSRFARHPGRSRHARAGHGRGPHCARPRPGRLRRRPQYGIATYCPVDAAGPLLLCRRRRGNYPRNCIGKTVWEGNPIVIEILTRARGAARPGEDRSQLSALLALPQPDHLPRHRAVVHRHGQQRACASGARTPSRP